MNQYKGENRRNGMVDRRDEKLAICTQPCKPIVESLEKIELKFEAEQKERDVEVHKKLDGIFACLADKIPSKLFWRVVYGLGILVFVVGGAGISGTLWSIYGNVLEVKGSVLEVKGELAVMAVTVNNTSVNLRGHMDRAQNKNDIFDERLDSIEQGTTFFNFYNKQHENPNP